MSRIAICVLLGILCFKGKCQTPQIWQDYVADRANGTIPELNDYSFAGYHFSEIEIPDVNGWTRFNVLDYGATADDNQFDDEAIQLAINAAEDHAGPAMVFFPPGRFMVSDNNNTSEFLRISRDSIVLKGSGSGIGGTEIFMKERRVQNGHWQFHFEPEITSISNETILAESALRGQHAIIVDDASGFTLGETVLISHQSPEFAEAHFGDLPLSSQWSRLFGSEGMRVYELHEVKAISGKRLTFVNPIQTDLPLLNEPYVISRYSTMQEVGVEDILFTSEWAAYPEDFVHHKDDIHDYGWNAIQFRHVKNGWIRNCELSSWSQGIDVRESIGVTIEKVTISGKQGHASFLTRRSYGLLVKDCEDPAGQHHGPGTGYSGVNTVYLRHKMLEDRSVDSHSGQPYATLMDDVDGGIMDQNGGPHVSYPHHGQDFTFWNYRHKSTEDKTYDFWSLPRNGNTYAYPNFIGFQANKSVTFIEEGINQMQGQIVSPKSLFEAQLALRRAETGPSINWITPGYGMDVEIGGDLFVEVDVMDDGSIEEVTLFLNGVQQRSITSSPYRWGYDSNLDPDLFDLNPNTYELAIEATDNEGNTTTDSIVIMVGQAPQAEFIKPFDNQIIASGLPLVVEAAASDADGSITVVSLYIDETLIGSIENPPFKWENEPELVSLSSGSYTLTVKATDNDGLVTEDVHNIIVNDFPVVAFLTVKNEQQFEYGDDVRVDVSATDSDGGIEEVKLFINGVFQRAEINPPYEWGKQKSLDPGLFDLPYGIYELLAVAKDDLGSESSSNISFVVNKQILNIENQKGQIEFFPNPFNQSFRIKSEMPIKDIYVFNTAGTLLSGVQMEVQSPSAVNLNTSELLAGSYFIHVIHEDDFKSVMKVIKRENN